MRWDVLPSGKHLEGAPLNFTYQVGQFGCEPYVISDRAKDELGGVILGKDNQLGI